VERSVRKPDFFIVGAPKCGTTAMQDYLRQHPEIFMPDARPPLYRGKELHFFGSDLRANRKILTKEEYLSHFREAKDEKRVGEATVWYLYSKRAAFEIKEFNPSSKIIIMLRKPVEMLYSYHSQLVYNGDEFIEDFTAAFYAEPDRKRGLLCPRQSSIPIERFFYREVVRYPEQVKRYFDVFGRENVHIIIFDDFKTDISRIYRDTLRFLDVDEYFEPSFKIINPNKEVRSKFLRDLLKNPPEVAQSVANFLIPKKWHQRFIEVLSRYNTKYKSQQAINPKFRKQLQGEFASEVEKLSELIGRDLAHWNK
jgi:hypothetical protein